MTVYIVRDREAGNEIERFMTREEAESCIQDFENLDISDGTYTPNFYEIYEKNVPAFDRHLFDLDIFEEDNK